MSGRSCTAVLMILVHHIHRYRQWKWIVATVIMIICIAPALMLVVSQSEATANVHDAAILDERNLKVVAEGQVVPEDGILTISASTTRLGPAVVIAVQVRTGDWVRA